MKTNITFIALGLFGLNFSIAKAEIVNQPSPDITVLKADANQAVNGYGGLGYALERCISDDAFTKDCTDQHEFIFQTPALHSIRVSSSYYSCRLLDVVTATRKDAFLTAGEIGFYYSSGIGSGIRIVPKNKMVLIGEVQLKNGETALLHRFTGLANCWQGTASSSWRARYTFKPFLGFQDSSGSKIYRNWDSVAENYLISPYVQSFDRSQELLKN
jgi:hypothetical protein